MLIDAMDIKHSESVASTEVHSPNQYRFITAWSDLLQSVGWNLDDTLQATASVTFPLGAPVTDGIPVTPKTVVGCNAPPGILTIGGQEYSLYDPFKQVPGSTTDCHFVEEGLTPGDTLGNLVDAINSDAVWFASLSYNGGVSWTLTVFSTSGGPLFNEYVINGNIISGGTTTYGGGYKLSSSGGTTSAQYSCTLTAADRGGAGDDYLNGILKFDFLINGGAVTYQLLNDLQGTLGFMGSLGVGPVPQYTIIANPYGFAVFDQPHDTTSHLFRFISLFCMAPYFPTSAEVPYTETFVPAYAVFVLGPNTVGGSPAWNVQAASTMALDDPLFQRFDKNPYARAMCYQSLTNPLLTVYGVPMFYGPYVMFGKQTGNTSPAWVVGKLWDCAIVTDYVAVGAGLDDQRDFLAIGSSDGSGAQTVGTFLMDAGTRGVYPPIGQSSRCAATGGRGGSGQVGNGAW